MPVNSIQSANTAAWSQLQQVQAERAAEQATAKARGLQTQARAAEQEADRAQENARSLRVQSNQADGDAAEANRSLSSLKSMSQVQGRLGELQTEIRDVLASDTLNSAAPVVNAYGEMTGSVVSVTA